MVFLDFYADTLDRHIVIDEEASFGWGYLTHKNSHRIDMDCWLYNRTETPVSNVLLSESEKYKQSPPPAPRDFLKEDYPLARFADLKNSDFSVKITEKESSVIILIKNEPIALINYSKRCVYNAWLNKDCPWGKCWILTNT